MKLVVACLLSTVVYTKADVARIKTKQAKGEIPALALEALVREYSCPNPKKPYQYFPFGCHRRHASLKDRREYENVQWQDPDSNICHYYKMCIKSCRNKKSPYNHCVDPNDDTQIVRGIACNCKCSFSCIHLLNTVMETFADDEATLNDYLNVHDFFPVDLPEEVSEALSGLDNSEESDEGLIGVDPEDIDQRSTQIEMNDLVIEDSEEESYSDGDSSDTLTFAEFEPEDAQEPSDTLTFAEFEPEDAQESDTHYYSEHEQEASLDELTIFEPEPETAQPQEVSPFARSITRNSDGEPWYDEHFCPHFASSGDAVNHPDYTVLNFVPDPAFKDLCFDWNWCDANKFPCKYKCSRRCKQCYNRCYNFISDYTGNLNCACRRSIEREVSGTEDEERVHVLTEINCPNLRQVLASARRFDAPKEEEGCAQNIGYGV